MGARLVRLRIAGFKSFAEAASLDILPGLNGIVGPNGCGKSNVVEALRWAMGESSARSLRGGDMDDLIFAGSAGRAAHNLAEVTLTLEDAAGLAPPPLHQQAELEVSRRIERGTGSAYRINARETRARDVQTLFADLASGARSSAMVSQGRVAALVGARPEERRSVLEEAAGITGLSSRRHEAELKLAAAEANLARAEDLHHQLEARLAELGTQAEQAHRYRTIAASLRDAEAGLLSLLHTRARRDADAAEQAAAGNRAALKEAERQAHHAAETQQQAHAALAQPTQDEAEARAGLEGERIATGIIAREQARAAEDAAEALRRLQQSQADRREAESRLTDATTAFDRLVLEQQALEARRTAMPMQVQQAERALHDAHSARMHATEHLSRATTLEAAARSSGEQSARDRDGASQRLDRLRDQLAGLEEEHAAALLTSPHEDRLAALDRARDQADKGLELARAEAEQAGEAWMQAARDLDSARLRAEQAGRVAEAAQRADQEVQQRVRSLMTARATLEDQVGRAEQGLVPLPVREAERQHVGHSEAALAEARAVAAVAEAESTAARAAHIEIKELASAIARRRAQLEQACRAMAASRSTELGLAEALAGLDAAQSVLTESNQTLAEADAAHLAAGEDANETARALAAAQAEQARSQAEIDGIRRSIDSTSQPNPGESWPSVAETLAVPPGLELAVASVLADGLHAALDEAAPQHWRQLDGLDREPALPAGAVALCALIEAPAALSRILRASGLIENPDEASEQQRSLSPGQCLVARDGRLWRWDGLRIAKSDALSLRASLLIQRNRLAAARIQLEDISRHVAEAAARAAASTEALAARSAEAVRARQARDRAERLLSDAGQGVATLSARHAAAEAASDAILPRHDPARDDAVQALALLPDTGAAVRAAALRETGSFAALADAQRAQAQAEEALHEARRRLAALLAGHGEAESRLEVLLPQRLRLTEDHDSARTEAGRARAACDALPAEGDAMLVRDRASQAADLAQSRDAQARQCRQEAERHRDRAHTEHADAHAALDRQRSRIEAVLARLAPARGEHDEAAAILDTLQTAAGSLPDLAHATAEAARARDALARADEQETQCREARARRTAEAAGIEEAVGRLTAAHSEWAAAQASALEHHSSVQSRLAADTRAAEMLADAPARSETRRAEQAVALEDAQRRYAAVKAVLAERTGELTQAQAARHQAETALAEARHTELRLKGRAEQTRALLAQLLAETPEPPRTQPADVSEQAEAGLRRRIARFAKEREEIGPVNLRAEIESAEAQAKALAMAQEREELEAAIGRLRGSIGDLDGEGRSRLLGVFTEVDRHFQTLFARMFGGGRAHLGMVGNDDPLAAGLEIYAQPPGKKLATLSLLSGGEQALCALCLIFAVFRCNPAPVCVLDEVDAPLDDANVARFVALLSDMVADTGTRFLVVTHHQLTMAHMDRLYGVTMQERGISRVLSVDLTAASGMAMPRRLRA